MSLQKWVPQGSALAHTSEHVGMGSKQLSRNSFNCVFPQWQVLIFVGTNSHSPHGPGWQLLPQVWFPQARFWPQTELQQKTPSFPFNSPLTAMSPQRTISVFFPQKQEAATRTVQDSQGPVWHTFSHKCRPHSSKRPHCWPQERGLVRSEHRRARIFFPQGHGRLGAKALQGGHGPGWH